MYTPVPITLTFIPLTLSISSVNPPSTASIETAVSESKGVGAGRINPLAPSIDL